MRADGILPKLFEVDAQTQRAVVDAHQLVVAQYQVLATAFHHLFVSNRHKFPLTYMAHALDDNRCLRIAHGGGDANLWSGIAHLVDDGFHHEEGYRAKYGQSHQRAYDEILLFLGHRLVNMDFEVLETEVLTEGDGDVLLVKAHPTDKGY